MSKILFAVWALTLAGAAYACSTSTVIYGGKMVTCTTCCVGGSCTTTCI